MVVKKKKLLGKNRKQQTQIIMQEIKSWKEKLPNLLVKNAIMTGNQKMGKVNKLKLLKKLQ